MDRRRTAPGDQRHRTVQARRQRLSRPASPPTAPQDFKAEPSRYLPLARCARLPLGAPHLDLPRGEEARWPHLGRLFDSRPKATGLAVRRRPALPRLHSRRGQRLRISASGLRALRNPAYTGKVDGADALGQNEPRPSSTTSHPRSSGGCSTPSSTHDRRRQVRLLSASRFAPRSIPVNERVYRNNVNNGVYHSAGFAKSAGTPTTSAYDGLFSTLDWLEERLSKHRYLVGNQITEADWRLFPTARPLRRRLLLDLQVQPAAHRGLSEPVELHA